MPVRRVLLAVVVLLATSRADAQTTDPCDLVNGTSVVGNVVTLLEDLDCSGIEFPPWQIVLTNGGTLDLNGFTLKADHAVRCDHESKPCTIMSSLPGGTLQGSLPAAPVNPLYDTGVVGDAGVRVRGVTITGFAGPGISASAQRGVKVTLEDATITANGGIGVIASMVQMFRSTVSNNGGGGVSSGGKITIVEDSEISGNEGAGISAAQKLKMERSTVSGNAGNGVQLIRAHYELGGPRAKLVDSTIEWNGGDGIRATDRPDGRIDLRTTTVSNNAASGIAFMRLVKVRDSAIANNGAHGIEASNADGCRVFLNGTTVTDNGVFGATLGPPAAPCSGGRFQAAASALTGSGLAPGCFTTQACGDVAALSLPPVLDATSVCDRSYILGSGVPGSSWSICTSD